jgi:hypothetical protein
MKTSLPLLVVLVSSVSLFSGTGFAQDPADPSSTPVTRPEVITPTTPGQGQQPATSVSTDPFGEMIAILESVTLDNRDGLTEAQMRLASAIKSDVNAWKSGGGTTSPAMDEKLNRELTDLEQKLQTLSMAGEDTWQSAHSNAESSLRELRSTYTIIMRTQDRT